MKKILFIFVLIIAGTSVFSQTSDSLGPILVYVDLKPTWAGCEVEKDSVAREACLEKNLTNFFNDFILYPERARKKKVEGIVWAQFVVEKDGLVSNIQIVHDIGEGCGEEVVRAIKHLPKLVPGENDGKPVRVLYKAPFHFKLK